MTHRKATSPAEEHLFEADDTALLSEDKRKRFKLLNLESKCNRYYLYPCRTWPPERVVNQKVERVLKYLNASRKYRPVGITAG